MNSPPPIELCADLLAAKCNSEKKRRRKAVSDFTSLLPMGGSGTPAVLDAIASICVSRQGETFAASVQIYDQAILLRIAGTGPVPPEVEMHLRKIWALMQQFRLLSRKVEDDHPSDKTHGLNDNYTLPAKSLGCEIYRFSFNKLKSRVQNHMPNILAASGKLPPEEWWEDFSASVFKFTRIYW